MRLFLTEMCDSLGSEFKIDPEKIWKEWHLYKIFGRYILMIDRRSQHYDIIGRLNGMNMFGGGSGSPETSGGKKVRTNDKGDILPDEIGLMRLANMKQIGY